MALRNIFIIGSVLATFVVSGPIFGQINIPGPRFRYKKVESIDSTRPFATPGVFDYDAQVFAPVEFTDGKELKPNTGYYATYDRTYASVSRAGNFSGVNQTAVSTGSDYIWGTRLEFGWMTDEDDGWGLVYQHADGSYFTNGQDILVTNPMQVETQISEFEINKLFRQTLKRGGYFEPYVGGRFVSVSDNTIEDIIVVTPLVVISDRFKQNTTNNAFGFQAGARVSQARGRWRSTCDGAIATTYNQQRYFATNINIVGTTQSITETYSSNQSFVPVLDLQWELAYHISRDISIRTGVQLKYLWDGIARANTLTTSLNPNSALSTVGNAGAGIFEDNFMSAGFIFGCEWRR